MLQICPFWKIPSLVWKVVIAMVIVITSVMVMIGSIKGSLDL